MSKPNRWFCVRCGEEVPLGSSHGGRFGELWVLCAKCASDNPEITARDVARWMYEEISFASPLAQADAADGICDLFDGFDKGFVYENQNGNLAIDSTVLREFRRLTEDKVVWSTGAKEWRRREAGDEPGRKQD